VHADSPRRLVIGHAISSVVEPLSNWTNVHHYSSNGGGGGMQLDYAFRVVCDVNYYGAGCSNYCRPRDDVHGHYTCASNGSRVCLDGWQEKFCDKGPCN